MDTGGYYEETTMQSEATGTGDGTVLPLRRPHGSLTTAIFQVTGISGDTITWEATLDGTNYASVAVEKMEDGTKAATATTNGLYRLVCHGLERIRARVSTYSAGTITVLGRTAV